jgi:hypothetical protein
LWKPASRQVGPGVEGFSVGDQVFAMADNAYAELSVINAVVLAKIPKGLDLIRAVALPLATLSGNQLSSATGIKAGPDGHGRRCGRKCRAFGGVHREGTRGCCDRGGFEEVDG